VPDCPALPPAVRLARRGESVVFHEAARQAGGTLPLLSRSATRHGLIDNGNHLLLSANHAALAYLRASAPRTASPAQDLAIRFMDLATGERLDIDINDGPLPLWLSTPSAVRSAPRQRLPPAWQAAAATKKTMAR